MGFAQNRPAKCAGLMTPTGVGPPVGVFALSNDGGLTHVWFAWMAT
jgi:hypothetical protein